MRNLIMKLAGCNLILGDCLKEIKKVKSGSVDLILIDPPYGQRICDWDVELNFDLMWPQIWNVLKPKGVIAIFGTEPFSSKIRMSQIKFFKYDWIWLKSVGNGFLNANKQPIKRHEIISVFYKSQPNYYPQKTEGKKYKTKRGKTIGNIRDKNTDGYITESDGLRFPVSFLKFKNEVGFHQTQKPVPLLEYLIKTYTLEGETVLDFTMGSGSAGVACVNTGRKFIGIEKDEKYFKIANERIKNITGGM